MAIVGRITTGEVFALSGLFLNVMAPMSEIHRLLDEGHETSLLVGDLLDLMAEPIDPSFATKEVHPSVVVRNKPVIVAEGLCVEYRTPRKERRWALQGISLAIQHGETIGIAGRSGSGKTTFLKVLLRLVHPHDGNLLICGKPIENVSRAEIGDYSATSGNAIRFFRFDRREHRLWRSGSVAGRYPPRGRMANLHDDICRIPGG